MRTFVQGVILGIAALTAAAGPAGEAIAIGEECPAESFKDTWYLPRTLAAFGDQQAFVIAFTALADPASEACLQWLKTLEGELDRPDVVVASVNAGSEDTIQGAAAQAIEMEAGFRVLKDFDGVFARALGVTQTPAVVVLDGERRLRYRGDTAHARAALDAVLAGDPVRKAEVTVEGRDIVRYSPPPAEAPITFTEHIAPIVYNNCTECHRPNSSAPFSLKSYKQVSARADMILEVVHEERMPPWYAWGKYGEFMNDRRLSQEQKDRFAQWIEAGKPEGDKSKMPEAPEFPEGKWEIGEPDLVLTLPEPIELPAQGYVPYQYVTLPYRFPHDTWVQGMEILPANHEVVHHANLAYTVFEEEIEDLDAVDAFTGREEIQNFLMGKVPGSGPVELPSPIGMVIPEGAVLTLQIHYVTTGEPETDQMSLGIRYAEGPVLKRVHNKRLRPNKIVIPPQEHFVRLSSRGTIEHNATVLALFGHMHLRGRDMKFMAEYPDGSEEDLLLIPNYSFDWQLAYQYTPGLKQMPKGTRITTVSHYDNSPFNPYNPDPASEVNYGQQTYHEMNDAYVFFLDNEETLNLMIDGDTGRPVNMARSGGAS